MDAGRIQTMAEQLIRENPKRRILDFTLEGQKYWIKRKLGNGRNQLVKYSVEAPMRTPATRPARMAK